MLMGLLRLSHKCIRFHGSRRCSSRVPGRRVPSGRRRRGRRSPGPQGIQRRGRRRKRGRRGTLKTTWLTGLLTSTLRQGERFVAYMNTLAALGTSYDVRGRAVFPSTCKTSGDLLLEFQLFKYYDVKRSSQNQQFGSGFLSLFFSSRLQG